MKNLCFSLFFFCSIFSLANAEVFVVNDYFVKSETEYSSIANEFNSTFGFQVKFISGMGLSMTNTFNDYSYIHFN